MNNRFIKFMYGRYGIDELYKFLFKIYICLLIINLFLKSSILLIAELILMIIMFYRVFSKKIYNRSNENTKFLKIKKNIFKIFKPNQSTIDKNHIYKNCHHCSTTLKLPIPPKKGIKHVKCPTCKKRNTYLILKCEKIEIIKNGRKSK